LLELLQVQKESESRKMILEVTNEISSMLPIVVGVLIVIPIIIYAAVRRANRK